MLFIGGGALSAIGLMRKAMAEEVTLGGRSIIGLVAPCGSLLSAPGIRRWVALSAAGTLVRTRASQQLTRIPPLASSLVSEARIQDRQSDSSATRCGTVLRTHQASGHSNGGCQRRCVSGVRRLPSVTWQINATIDRPLLGESRHSLAAPLSLWFVISHVAFGS